MSMNFSDLFGGGGVKPWVSGATYAAGKVAMSPADNYQLYVRVVAGAGTTDPSADATNWKPFGARAIKSVQRGTVAPPTIGNTSTTVTISAVNTAKSISIISSAGSVSSANQIGSAGGGLTSSTQLTVLQASSGGNNLSGGLVYWQVLEYY